jgi:phage shock protein PspC (stress-responsive transcriptional regulator)
MTSAPPPTPPPPPALDPPAWAPPPPPPGPPARPQLHRSRTDKILGGVSGGLAEYSGIDALLWRVGFVALALAGGTGVVVYLLLWLLMPAGPVGSSGATAPGAPAAPKVLLPRSPVGRLTIGALLVVVALLALLDRLTGLAIGGPVFFGAALLVVGLGLVAAAFSTGRTARGGLIALGVLLSLGLITSSAEPWHNARGGVGDRTFIPAAADSVRPVYQGGFGDMTLDLRKVDVSDLHGPIVTKVEHGVGDLHIYLPEDADARIAVEAGVGSVDVLGQGSPSDGFFPGSGTGSWVGDDRPEIDLTINSGLGDVEVSRG